ncbi:MAG: Fic family protein [candidate division KSB1 bacterium]|nr:Fic family protein [candidate division KSB1 bacterium]
MMRVTDTIYFAAYHDRIGHKIPNLISNHDFSEGTIEFSYSTRSSAVYSANIEGNPLDLNSYMNQKRSQTKFKSKELQEIDNLIAAYELALQNELNETNFLACQALFSKTLLIKSKRETYRDEKVGVYDQNGLVYLAIEPEKVKERMNAFFQGITTLLKADLSEEATFYHASLIHLIFVHIHPFLDGNGRGARLLEKWFISQVLGEHFWKIPSEKYYWDHRPEYYENINLGVNYYELDDSGCLPFLAMLPGCLAEK